MSKYDSTISQELVRELFDCPPEGGLVWKKKTNALSRAKIGEQAGCRYKDGYIIVLLKKCPIPAHRIIFLWHHGWLPPTIDHINGIKDDNRIENLRAATYSQNNMNRKSDANCHGLKGVSYSTYNKRRFRATITVNGKYIHIGVFDTAQEAHEAYCQKAKELHGEFAHFD